MGYPESFSEESLPFEEMLPTDKIFLPRVLEGELFATNFQFSDAELTSVKEFGFKKVKKENLHF
jgi:hypothetical protein